MVLLFPTRVVIHLIVQHLEVKPAAVHINVNITPRTPESNGGKGTVKVAPFGEAATTKTVIVKSNLGVNSSNAVTVPICQGCAADIDVRTTGQQVDIIIEILGYYYPVEEIDANGVAIAHGYVQEDGTLNSGTDNVSSTWNAAGNRYEITIAGESYFFDEYTTLVTLGSSSSCRDAIAVTDSSGGVMWLSFRDVEGTGAGTDKQCAFMFATYKNKFVP